MWGRRNASRCKARADARGGRMQRRDQAIRVVDARGHLACDSQLANCLTSRENGSKKLCFLAQGSRLSALCLSVDVFRRVDHEHAFSGLDLVPVGCACRLPNDPSVLSLPCSALLFRAAKPPECCCRAAAPLRHDIRQVCLVHGPFPSSSSSPSFVPLPPSIHCIDSLSRRGCIKSGLKSAPVSPQQELGSLSLNLTHPPSRNQHTSIPASAPPDDEHLPPSDHSLLISISDSHQRPHSLGISAHDLSIFFEKIPKLQLSTAARAAPLPIRPPCIHRRAPWLTTRPLSTRPSPIPSVEPIPAPILPHPPHPT